MTDNIIEKSYMASLYEAKYSKLDKKNPKLDFSIYLDNFQLDEIPDVIQKFIKRVILDSIWFYDDILTCRKTNAICFSIMNEKYVMYLDNSENIRIVSHATYEYSEIRRRESDFYTKYSKK